MHGEAPAVLRNHRRAFLAVGVALVVLLGAVAGFRAWLTQDPDDVSVADAVNRFRESSAPPTTTVDRDPAPGVYVYRTSGEESVDALGGDSHTYPEQTVLTVTPNDCGFTLTWTPVAERADTMKLCRTGDVLVDAATINSHTFFHVTQSEEFTCDPGAWWLPPAAITSWTANCRSTDKTTIRVARLVGREPVTVGDVTVDAVHVRFDDTISGASTGTSNTDWWLDPVTGLPLRQHATTTTSNDSQIGHVSFSETIDLSLLSLTPQT